MTEAEALSNLRIGVEAFVGNWQQHRVLQESLRIIEAAIGSAEVATSQDESE